MGVRPSIWQNMPWCDPAGRVSPVKLAVFVVLWLPAAWMAGSVSTLDWAFPSPYVPLIYHSGLWATYLLLLSLAVTPARRILNWPRAAQLRRMIGVAAFAYTLLHVLSWIGLRFFDWSILLSELAARPSLWIASIATLGLLALAATSIDAAMRRLGPLWKKLHRTVYVLAFLAVLHFLMSPGSLQGAPFLMAALYAWLMGWRLLERRGLGTNLGSLALLGSRSKRLRVADRTALAGDIPARPMDCRYGRGAGGKPQSRPVEISGHPAGAIDAHADRGEPDCRQSLAHDLFLVEISASQHVVIISCMSRLCCVQAPSRNLQKY